MQKLRSDEALPPDGRKELPRSLQRVYLYNQYLNKVMGS